jgi:6-pyruvoyltetrahydropterin/6-carboxytetrahydropterin synthase
MATIVLCETYAFCGAHRVPELVGRDQQLHGHVWTVRLDVRVFIPAGKGCAFDHARLNAIAASVLGRLDHRCINDVEGLAAGTNEALAEWIGVRIEAAILASDITADCQLQGILLTQFGPDEGFRLTTHEVLWSPDEVERVQAHALAGRGEG